MIKRIVSIGLVLGCIQAWVAGADWAPANGPLKTRWAKDVSPANSLPDYPRPQLARPDWMNLNGLWDYSILVSNSPAPESFEGKILVPYPIESALSGVMKRVDEKSRLWYRRTVELPAGWAGKRVLLHCGAVDWEAQVLVNGQVIGSHRGGYDSFSFDITPALKPSGPQQLTIAVWDPTEAGQPRGKQVRRPGGIMYTPSSGIWQTIWLEPVPESHISALKVQTELSPAQAVVTVDTKAAEGADTVQVTALAEGREVSRASGKPGAALRLALADAKLWSPESPFLYDLKVELRRGDRSLDAVTSYFGVRKIELAKDEKGILRPFFNGKFVFQNGPLDQGFWPDGLYTAPTDEALRYDIEVTKQLGFNMTRKHVKVEPERWYYWCDKLGLMVWQDMPSGNNRSAADKEQYERELQAMVETHRNHPSIVMWVVFNEGWGQYDTERVTAWTKQLDPSRLVNNASGWTDRKVGDVIDMHNYPGPGSPRPETSRAAVLGEFGGLGLGIDGHTWSKQTWGYQGMASRTALTTRYLNLMRKVWALKDDPGLSTAVYTQITDVETECNGLLTYDREMIKPELEKVAAANRGEVPPAPVLSVVVPTARREAVVWRYTFEQPQGQWFAKTFDDSSWKQGPAGFGSRGTPGSTIGTEWRGSDIWLRRQFELPQGRLAAPSLMLHHDESAEVYINGVLASKVNGYSTDYEETEISQQARDALSPGPNVMAVHCHQTQGGQYIDVGIVEAKPAVK